MTALTPAWVVTTSRAPDDGVVARALEIAERCGVPYRPREGRLVDWLADPQLDAIYVVARDRERIVGRDEPLVATEGLLKLRASVGRAHPFLRAVAPPEAQPVRRMIDGTLGLAQDALHAAYGIEVEVEGIEASHALATLVQAGLRRLADHERWGPAARRVSVRTGHAGPILSELGSDSVPVVFLDPMFERPLRTPPGYDALRRLARGEALDPDTWAAARDAAARRLVVKVPCDADPPVVGRRDFNRRVVGKAVDFFVVEKELPEPEWEAPKPGRKYPYRRPRR